MPLMTQAEYARSRGVAKSLITKFKNQGKLDGAFRRKPGGKQVFIVSGVADKLLAQNLDPAFTKDPDSSEISRGKGDQTYIDARTWSERYKAADRKLEYEIKTGKWVLKVEVRDGVFKAGRVFRDGLMNVPPRIAAILAVEIEEFKIVELLNKEFAELLKDLVRMLNAIGR